MDAFDDEQLFAADEPVECFWCLETRPDQMNLGGAMCIGLCLIEGTNPVWTGEGRKPRRSARPRLRMFRR